MFGVTTQGWLKEQKFCPNITKTFLALRAPGVQPMKSTALKIWNLLLLKVTEKKLNDLRWALRRDSYDTGSSDWFCNEYGVQEYQAERMYVSYREATVGKDK